MQSWYETLIDEYPTRRTDGSELRSQASKLRLLEYFHDQEPAVMETAVRRYMLAGERFFPRVADLAAYVNAAKETARGQSLGSEHLCYGRWPAVAGRKYSDEEIYLWELGQGTMPPVELIGREYPDPDHPQAAPPVLAEAGGL